MKHLVYILSSVIAGIFTLSIFGQAPIFGLQPDLLFVCTLCCVLIEDSPVPVIYTAIVTVLTDLFYTGGVGMYSIPYVLSLLIAMWAMHKRNSGRLVRPVCCCAAAWLLKDCLSALMVFLSGKTFDFFDILLTHLLPELLINCLLMAGLYQLYLIIFGKNNEFGGNRRGFAGKRDYKGVDR